MTRSSKRSWAKALTYRFICTAETFLISWLVTGSWETGGTITGILFLIKVATYFIHERVWEKIAWGKGNKYGKD